MGGQKSKLMDEKLITGLSFLEEGEFAKIYKGYFGGSTVSIKVPRVPDNIRKEKKKVKVHIEEVKKLMPSISKHRSENTVRVFGVAYDDFRKEVWVIRQFVDGIDLETLMNNPSLCPKLGSPESKLSFAVGIAKGMAFLHRKRSPIVHGDFRPSDVLIDGASLTPKITNYGLWDFKKFFIENTLPDHIMLLNPYQAPEVLLNPGERPTLFSDLWCLGAVILEWLMELHPWDINELCDRYRFKYNKQAHALKTAMEKREDPTVLYYMDDSREEHQQMGFLRDCLSYDVFKRPSAKSIEDSLISLSSQPTWTNVAYHKYYSNNQQPLNQ